MSLSGANTVVIATLTQTSIDPSSRSTRVAASSTSSKRETSVGITSAWAPTDFTSAAAPSSPARPRASRATSNPCAASAIAVARPTPADPPVTTATLASIAFPPRIAQSASYPEPAGDNRKRGDPSHRTTAGRTQRRASGRLTWEPSVRLPRRPSRRSGQGRRGHEPQRELMDLVALPVDALPRPPNEFSGGQRQRIAMPRAPRRQTAILVADEPISALDVSIQATRLAPRCLRGLRVNDRARRKRREAGISAERPAFRLPMPKPMPIFA
jgi:ABC-type dipeptide/oligopeptide/nickel transport system ATPase component